MSDYYSILNLDPEASFTVIEDAYQRLARSHAGDEVTMRRLKEAWLVLSNPVTRKEYDRALAQPPAAPSSPPAGPDPATPRRPGTEVIDLNPARPDKPGRRPRTEEFNVVPPAPTGRPPRPATEMIEVVPPAATGRPPRPATEMIDIVPPTPLTRPPRPMTEYIETGLSANTRPKTEWIENEPDVPAATPPASSLPAPAGSIRVIVTGPDGKIEEYTLDNGMHVIGRPSKNVEPSVKLNDRFVSRSHAIIIKEPGSVVIRDENSVNGTRLKDERLAAGRLYPLQDGDVVKIEGFVLRMAFGVD